MPRKKTTPHSVLVGTIEDMQLPSTKARSTRAMSLLIRHDIDGMTRYEWITVAKAIRPRVVGLAKLPGLLIGTTCAFTVDDGGNIIEFKRIDGS